jgi:DNA-binding MarR family transcriptional regulator
VEPIRSDAGRVDDTAAWRPDPEKRTSLLFDVFVLGQRTRELVNAAMDDAGLRPDEYATYSVIFERGPITLTDLAAALGMPVTTVADYVRVMGEERHVAKRPHPTDGRASLLALTPGGLRAHRRASRSFERAHQAMLQELGAMDEGATREVLQRLASTAERALNALEVRHRAG